MARARKRGGSRKAVRVEKLVTPPAQESKYPILCLRHVQPGYGVEEMTANQRSEFLLKWSKRAAITWDDLMGRHRRHNLGTEYMPAAQILPQIPERLKQERYIVMRHEGRLPFVGFRAGNVFHVLWIAGDYKSVYKH